MATPNRWAVRDAAEVTLFDLGNKKPVVTLKTLKMTEVETTGETVYSMGGRGNAKLVGFSGNREARVTLQDAIFDNAALAMMTGNEVKAGARDVQLVYDAKVADGKVTLPKTAKSVDFVYELDGRANGAELEETDFSVIAQEVTISKSGVDRVRVYYTHTTPEDAKTVLVTASDFGGTFRLVADVLIKDEATQKVFYGQFIAPRAKVEDEFTFSFSPDGDPAVLDIPIEILKDVDTDNMWELVIYGDEDLG